MGDAGSMLIGFTLIWVILIGSQNQSESAFRPVTALWLIAIPLMDMVAVMIRRMYRGHSPFMADRTHLHHLLMEKGFSARETLVLVCFSAFLFATIGVFTEILNVPEFIMFYSFLVCFILYFSATSYLFSVCAKNTIGYSRIND